MNRLLIVLALILAFISTSTFAAERVQGHWKDTDHDGYKDTYVEPYYRSNRNDNPYDNYSTKGNINPYTEKKGSVDPYRQNNSYDPYNPYK